MGVWMPRERRSFNRISGVKDPSLIVIAMEGAATEQDYFAGVELTCEQNSSRLKVIRLPRRDNAVSAAKYVLAQMDGYKKEFGIGKEDELCLVIDRDAQSLTEGNLADIARKCAAKQYLLALSNPCFEIWLILHHLDVEAADDAVKQKLFENKRQFTKEKLRELVGSYNPSNLNFEDFWPHTQIAIARARQLDTAPAERWPNTLGTRIYLILEKVISSLSA